MAISKMEISAFAQSRAHVLRGRRSFTSLDSVSTCELRVLFFPHFIVFDHFEITEPMQRAKSNRRSALLPLK